MGGQGAARETAPGSSADAERGSSAVTGLDYRLEQSPPEASTPCGHGANEPDTRGRHSDTPAPDPSHVAQWVS